jgi:hypothetical protein
MAWTRGQNLELRPIYTVLFSIAPFYTVLQ